jgi:hypothetical protein
MHREKILLRDAADIHRAQVRVATRRTLPHLEVSTDRFPPLVAGRAQDRLSRLTDACNCLLGEVLGGATLLAGIARAWVWSRSWVDAGLVLIAALAVLLIGKAIEICWTRMRMLLVLAGLRRRLDSSQDLPATKPVGYAWLESPAPTEPASSTELAASIPAPGRRARRAPRPSVVLGNAADINRLCLRLATRWTMPRIDIRVDGLPEQHAQRARHHYMRLTDGASFMLAGVLAALTLLGGMLHVLWMQNSDGELADIPELWNHTLGWSDMQPVLIAALVASLLGWAIELLVIRMRLLRVLRGLRRRVQAQG